MGVAEAGLLKEIAVNSQNDLLIFFIILSVLLIVVLIPLYRIVMSERLERRKHEQERIRHMEEIESERLDKYILREAHIIGVIKENSEVISGLKVALESMGINTNRTLDRLMENQRQMMNDIIEIRNAMDMLH